MKIFCWISPVESGVGLTLKKKHKENQTQCFKGLGCFRVVVEVCFLILAAADDPRMFKRSRSDFLRTIHLAFVCTRRKIHFVPVKYMYFLSCLDARNSRVRCPVRRTASDTKETRASVAPGYDGELPAA